MLKPRSLSETAVYNSQVSLKTLTVCMHQQPRPRQVPKKEIADQEEEVRQQEDAHGAQDGELSSSSILTYLRELDYYQGLRSLPSKVVDMMEMAEEWCGEVLGAPVLKDEKGVRIVGGREISEPVLRQPAGGEVQHRRSESSLMVDPKERSNPFDFIPTESLRGSAREAWIAAEKRRGGLGSVDKGLMEHLRGSEKRWGGEAPDLMAMHGEGSSSLAWEDEESSFDDAEEERSSPSQQKVSSPLRWKLPKLRLSRSFWRWLGFCQNLSAEDKKWNDLFDSLDDSFAPMLSFHVLGSDDESDESEDEEELGAGDEDDESADKAHQTRSADDDHLEKE